MLSPPKCIRSFKNFCHNNVSLFQVKPFPHLSNHENKEIFDGAPHGEQSYNVFQRAFRVALGLDKMEKKLDYLYQHGLVKDDLHEIGNVNLRDGRLRTTKKIYN